MYALKLPDPLVRRLYRLREEHGCGPIRRQVLLAVERYVDETEQRLTAGSHPAASPARDASRSLPPSRVPDHSGAPICLKEK